jgi:signal peptidase II
MKHAKYWIMAVLTPALVVIDQWSKSMIVSRFRLGESIPIVSGLFNVTYVRNTGAAFGILAQANPVVRIPFFVVVPCLAMAAIAYVFRKIPKDSIRLSAALSCVVGGAIGNLIDRLFLGYVVDFLDFHWNYQHHFPAFNAADTVICIGVGVLVLDLVLHDESTEPQGALSDAS